jgi:alpha-D-ribose 1-methylphosphonate 5-phosphate C-P lyase
MQGGRNTAHRAVSAVVINTRHAVYRIRIKKNNGGAVVFFQGRQPEKTRFLIGSAAIQAVRG